MDLENIPKRGRGRPRKNCPMDHPNPHIANSSKLPGYVRSRRWRLRKKLAETSLSNLEEAWDIEQKFLKYIPLGLQELDQRYPLFA